MMDISNIAVVVGLDVGKSEHHAVAVDPAGTQLASSRLPQDESGLRDFIAGLQRRGPVIVVVDHAQRIR
ncbi:MAG: IS110 family transposase [Actinomycetota bacterium]|nr:IS110 family transposase [Actinomycetota bacterium]